ncbi:MAG TPA: hypothetical protein VM052_01390 [Candidatus Limnocylindrales bacterium]|nr:hypothetical protein [Candidatus Limnocylindrales bacterium]
MFRSLRALVASLAITLIACSSGSDTAAPTLGAVPTAGASIPLRVLVTSGEGGAPVAGARVCASRAASVTPACATADKDGSATLFGSPGTYFVRISGPAEQRWAETTRVADLAGGPAAVWVEIQPQHRISGTIRDVSGAKIRDAQACAHPALDEATVCARTGADGAYAIDVKAGIYRLEVTGPAGARLVSQWARGRAFVEEADVLDARIADVPDVDVDLIRGNVLSGVVTFAGSVVEDAQVCLRTLAAPMPIECERTDKQGRFAALREPGDYYIWTVPPNTIRAIPQWWDGADTGVGSTPLNLASDRRIDVALRGGTTISGTLRATDGELVVNALVCFDTPFPTGRICRETGGDGRYTITTRPETYVVNVIPPAHSDLIAEYWQRARTWPEADEYRVGTRDATLDITVRRGTVVNGVVTNSRDIGVIGGFVGFWDGTEFVAATQTDSAGRFELVVLPGHYRVVADPPYVGTANLVGKEATLDVPAQRDVKIVLDDIAP